MSMPSQQLGDQAKPRVRPRRSIAAVKEERAAFLFLTPWFAGLFLFLALPLGYAVYISMTDRRLISGVRTHFIGLDNYVYMFTQDGFFYHALYITMKWLVLSTPLFLTAGLLISLLLNQKYFGMNVFRTIVYIPAVVSGVAVAVLWLQLLNPELGVVNYMLTKLGVDNPPYWLEDPQWAMPAVLLMGLWGVGGYAIIYLAGLQNIPPHLYEAATIDGAGAWAKFRHITLPMLSPTIFFLVFMNVIGVVLSSSSIVFPFARLRFRGKNVLFTFLIATMLLPAPVLLIPQFLLFYQIGWYGTYYPLWVPAFAGNAFFIFLMRQYMRSIPIELDEAARVDGAGYWTIYWRIVMPLCVPVLTVAAVFQFMWTWNDFFGPLIYLDDPEKFTVALALAAMVQRIGTEWNEVMAANLLVMLPVLVVYFFAQDKLIGGIANVGLKG